MCKEMALNILLIDDMKPLLTIMKNGLGKYGHKIYSALSGKEGLEVFRTTPIDLIVCDLGMEDMDGWEVGKAIMKTCNDKGIPKTPFILLTGWGCEPGYQERIAEFGVDVILEKPVEIPELMEVVGNLVK